MKAIIVLAGRPGYLFKRMWLVAGMLAALYFHTTNPATHYRSGQEFSFDYLVGQHFGRFGQFRIGANGHVAFQTTDDTFSNQPATFDGHNDMTSIINKSDIFLDNNR